MIQKLLLRSSSLILFFFLFSFSTTFAQGFLGFQEEAGCERENEKFLPSLVVCGRSPSTSACEAYTKPCNMGDFVETGRRALVWIITIVLMLLPLVIAYYGVLMMVERKFSGGADIAKLKEKILMLIIYFVCLLGAWIIVRTIVDVTQVDSRINTFLIDESGNRIEARQVDFNR